ncbi:MAG: type I glyceraldehyde-3-phosphate dehydrogenase [Armatimonadota bacterium]
MATRVAINGFGRIGRQVLRAGIDEEELEFVAANDLGDKETLAYLLQFDSVHGLMDRDVEMTEGGLSTDGEELLILRERDPGKLPWKDLGIDLVIEASGKFASKDAAQAHLDAGARKVLITAPASDVDATIVLGVNEELLDMQSQSVISSASCTTNTFAVIAKVLQESFGIDRGMMLTVHAYTNSQALLDTPVGKLRRSRAAAINLVPTSTGAAKTIYAVIPELQGRLNALAVRCPIPDGSLLDFTAILGREVDAEVVNEVFEAASETDRLQDILLLSHDPLVSTDIVGTSFTTIVDAESTTANGNLVKVLAWYDNEWGYSCRVVDLAVMMAEQMSGA